MTTKHNHSFEQARHTTVERHRGFLTKSLVGGAALAAVLAMTTITLADDQAAQKGKGRGGAGRAGRGGPVEDTAFIAARMISEFDKNGDKSLNQAELAEAIKAAHQRGMQGAKGGRGQAGGAAGGGKGQRGAAAGDAAAGGKRKGGGANAAGGKRRGQAN